MPHLDMGCTYVRCTWYPVHLPGLPSQGQDFSPSKDPSLTPGQFPTHVILPLSSFFSRAQGETSRMPLLHPINAYQRTKVFSTTLSTTGKLPGSIWHASKHVVHGL